GRTRSGGGARAGVACREGLQPRRRERVRLVVGDRTIRGARSAGSAPGPHDVGFRSALSCWLPPTGRRAVYSASHVHVPPRPRDRPLGRPAATPPRLLERGGRAGRVDHRRRDLPYAGGHRRTRAGAAADVRRVGAGRVARVVRRPHIRGARGAVSALGRRVRVHPRGIRPVAGVPLRVDRAGVDPGVRAGRDFHAVCRVPAALDRPGSGAPRECGIGALRGRGRHRGHRGSELLRGALERVRLESHHRREVRRAAVARAAGVFRRARRLDAFHDRGGAVRGVVRVATFSTLVGSILTAPRIFFAMADDGLFFRAIARVHPRYQTPSAAIVLTGFLGIGFVLIRTFEQLADQFVVAIFPFYALAAAAVFVLRRRRPDLPRPVRVLGYPVVPSLFVLASFLILGNALWAHPRETGFAFLIILLGVPVYSWWTRRRRSGVTQM